MRSINNIFKIGDIVSAKVKPETALIVRLYAYNIYYCTVKDRPEEKDQVYFERELQLFNPKS